MREACSLVWLALVGLFRSRASLEAEILILRHQLNIQRRQSPKRLNFSTLDRLIFAGLYCLAPSVLGALAILKPETVIRWHRAGFRSYWRWKSRHRGGRPTVPLEIRELIRGMRRAPTCRWTRMRPYRARFREQGVFLAFQSWAACITNMFGFDLRQAQASNGQGGRRRHRQST